MADVEYQANEGTADALPKGEATQLNDLVQDLDLEVEEPVAFPEDELAGLDELPPMEGNLTGFDDLVFGATDRPDEPISSGASWGAGPMGFSDDGKTPAERAKDMALYTLNTSRELRPTSKSLLARIIRGD
jgi:hypothetical protein